MGNRKWTDDYFRKRIKTERERRGWTQAQMAAALDSKAVGSMHWTTIAKIEKGTRSVRIDEAAAIADLFGISVDALLGRRARPVADRVHILTTAADTATRSTNTILDVADAVQDRIADLSPSDDDPSEGEDLIASYERVYDLLVGVNDALTNTAQMARHAIRDQTRKLK
jgi:transcriptional regulator with XRE-family HTH domain